MISSNINEGTGVGRCAIPLKNSLILGFNFGRK